MIRRERKRAGLTMQQAADRLGVSFLAYQRWEDLERCNATISTLDRIAEALGRQLQFGFTLPEASSPAREAVQSGWRCWIPSRQLGTVAC